MIRIVHVTDLHFGPGIETYSPPRMFSGRAGASVEALRRLQDSGRRELAEKEGQPSVVCCVISGDLTTRGDPDALRQARAFVESSIELMERKELRTIGLGYDEAGMTMVPGNHDIWGGHEFPFGLLGAPEHLQRQKEEIRRLFGDEYPARWSTPGTKASFIDDEELRIRCYLLDSTSPALRNLLARGCVGAVQLDCLEKQVKEDAKLDEADGKKCLRIAIIHHPLQLISELEWYQKAPHWMEIYDAEEVRKRLDGLGFGLVLCGHEHIGNVTEISNGFFQAMTGSSTQTTAKRDSNRYQTYDIKGDGDRATVTIRSYETPLGGGAFRAVPGKTEKKARLVVPPSRVAEHEE